MLHKNTLTHRFLHVALTAAVLCGCSSEISDVDALKTVISTGEVRALVTRGQGNPDAVLLIDPRSPADFAAGHLPGAMNLSIVHVSGVSGQKDPRLERAKTLVVYGNDPGSAVARAMVKRLIATGYKDVRYYQDGWSGWDGSKVR